MLEFDVSPYRLSGTVCAALLNDPRQIAALGEAAGQPPYKAPPAQVVLALKPRNTLAGAGAAVTVPAGVEALEMGASLAIVIGRTACRVPEPRALEVVAGYTIANDIAVPGSGTDMHYRPGLSRRARDGFCVIGPRVTPAAAVPQPDALGLRVFVDGELVQSAGTGGRRRSVARLLADVTAFMTLQPGDVLLLGPSHPAPLARAGQQVAIEIDGLGALQHRLVAGEGGA